MAKRRIIFALGVGASIAMFAAQALSQAHGYNQKSGGLRNGEQFRWNKPSRPYGPMQGKARDRMPQTHKTEEELIDLLEDANSTDQQIREKIDALQQARENARKALHKAKQEFAALLTTPRQEAIFLIKGDID